MMYLYNYCTDFMSSGHRGIHDSTGHGVHNIITYNIPCRHYTLDQRWNEVQNDVTTLFQLHFNVVPMSDARWVVSHNSLFLFCFLDITHFVGIYE